ncbi:MAG: GNAT family N-acetyltransferase, partial [bacterium]
MMEKLYVVNVSREFLPEFSRFCVPEHRARDEAFLKGVALKEAWVRDKLDRGEPFAKMAILEGEIAGIVQFQPVPEEGIFHLLCIFVPRKEHWGKGVGSLLLDSLIEEAKKP